MPMQILLTGGSGMLGSAIKEKMKNQKHSVLSPTSSELNLFNENSCRDFFTNNPIDLVIHCAARVGGIKANIEFPYQFLNDNLRIDMNLLGISREFRVKNLLYISSSCVYPRDSVAAMEESVIGSGTLESTNEGYALAKLVGMKSVAITAKEFDLQWRILVLSNLYGPGDHFEPDRSHLISAIIAKVLAAKSTGTKIINMWGDGTAKREFTFVNDVADFINRNLENLERFPQILNLGSGKDYSVREYYFATLQAIGYQAEIEADVSRPSGMQRKLLNSTKAESLGWDPMTTLEEGLKLTLDWYFEQKSKIDEG